MLSGPLSAPTRPPSTAGRPMTARRRSAARTPRSARSPWRTNCCSSVRARRGRTPSPSIGRRDGMARVCQLWEIPRSTLDARRERARRPAQSAAKRRPKRAWTDEVLTGAHPLCDRPLAVHRRGLSQGVSTAALRGWAHREGPRAAVDAGGGPARTDAGRPPPRAAEPRRHDHDRAPRRDVGHRCHGLSHHPATVCIAVDHYTKECIGIRAARPGTRFEALEPLRQSQRPDGVLPGRVERHLQDAPLRGRVSGGGGV